MTQKSKLTLAEVKQQLEKQYDCLTDFINLSIQNIPSDMPVEEFVFEHLDINLAKMIELRAQIRENLKRVEREIASGHAAGKR